MINTLYTQILNITSKLILTGLSVQQNYPSIKEGSIYISGNKNLSVALKNISYDKIYSILEEENNYNIKMIDGALIQLMYSFENNVLKKYRLAFFPSPNLEEFQNNSEIYEMDEIYADIIDKNIITTPIRFDYDPENYSSIDHPKSHLTIGQYTNCRIPVYAPITPNIFINFILRNFYNTAFIKFTETLNFKSSALFENCIDDKEKKILYLASC